MSVFSHKEFDQHEQVVFCADPASGLRAIISVHSTAIGPGAGGCRMWNYASDDEALTDVLRLSKGMSYKNALAEIRFGGGKAVIMGDPGKHKTAELFRAFGRAVERQGGNYITAEDVGVRVADMEEVATQTRYVSGLSPHGGSFGGDPSPWTARGVFVGMVEAVRHHLGVDSMKGLRVAVQGLGGVGYDLCRRLHQAGAQLIVADIDQTRLQRVCAEFGAEPADANGIIGAEADVYSPCALGAVLNEKSIGKLQATVVAGAANNQLATPEDGEKLKQFGVLYAPDYVINAGGIISAEGEYFGDLSEAEVASRVDAIGPRLRSIFIEAGATVNSTNEIADALARTRIANAARKNRLAEVPEKIAS